jgi:hypothetical protein
VNITVSSPFPGAWQAQDEDSIDGEVIDGVTRCTGMIATGRTRREALLELREQYQEIVEWPEVLEDQLNALQAQADIDNLLALS